MPTDGAADCDAVFSGLLSDRHGRARRDHPRLFLAKKTWMVGTRPTMTTVY
jgi:hypothetical protein